MRIKSGALAIALMAFGMAPAFAQDQSFFLFDKYPTWISLPTDAVEETVVLKHSDHLTLFNLRPFEAFRLIDPALDKKKKERLPAGTELIRVPAPQLIACEAFRPKGNERFTCLRDLDGDGTFDEYFRPVAESNLYILPIQEFQPEFEPLSTPALYREMDERTESATSQFIMQYVVQGKNIIIRFCFEPYRRVSSWGYPHTVDDCLVEGLSHRRGREYPHSASILGVEVAVLAYDQETKEVTFHIRRKAEEYPISFSYQDN